MTVAAGKRAGSSRDQSDALGWLAAVWTDQLYVGNGQCCRLLNTADRSSFGRWTNVARYQVHALDGYPAGARRDGYNSTSLAAIIARSDEHEIAASNVEPRLVIH